MKRAILILAMTAFFLQAVAQISVGLRNNRFIHVAYLYKDHYFASLEQSVFSEALGLQYMRGYAGYLTTAGAFRICGTAYYGSTFNRLYYSTGASADVMYRYRRIYANARFNPHYDSGFGYTSCYYGGIGCGLSSQIDVFAAFTNTLEYRMPEKRLNVGFNFHVKNIRVTPRLSLNVSSNSGPKTLRPLIDFEYIFHNTASHE